MCVSVLRVSVMCVCVCVSTRSVSTVCVCVSTRSVSTVCVRVSTRSVSTVYVSVLGVSVLCGLSQPWHEVNTLVSVSMTGRSNCCLMSSDVSCHIRDKLRPMPKHGSV